MPCIFSLGANGDITTPPNNNAVLNGTSNVTISCASSTGYFVITWSYVPVGSSFPVTISVGLTVVQQQQFYAVEQSGSNNVNLIILSATTSRAGTYVCSEGANEAYAQLIVISKFICLSLEIFNNEYCEFLHLGGDGAITMSPTNKAVLLGSARVNMSCTSSYGFQAIGWSYTPIGSSIPTTISFAGSNVVNEQQQFYAVEQSSGSNQNNLIILTATTLRAGTYLCNEG